jgi:lipopolysaccharide transport system ATP-binding protein
VKESVTRPVSPGLAFVLVFRESAVNVGIVGTFDVQNYGDLLFPLIAEFELRKRLGDVTMHRFSYHAKSAPDWPFSVIPVAALPDVIQELDALLVGGGDVIRFDKDVAPSYAPPSPRIHHPTGYWLTPSLIAHAHGIPVIWNAPGVHLDVPEWARPLVKLALELSGYVSVRDDASKETLAPLLDHDRIEVVPDTAFGVSRLLGPTTDAAEPYIAIQPSCTLANFQRFVKAHQDRFAGYRLLAVPIGPVLGDEHAFVRDLGGIVRLPSWPQPLQLAQILSNASAVVGHSYHLAITALTAGVPVFTPLELDEGKWTTLRRYETVYRFGDVPSSDSDWFFSRVGKTAPASSVRDTLPLLDKHWDRVAGNITAGRLPKQPALRRFLRELPAFLEMRSPA